MADPRQTARAWLAERLWHDGLMHVMSPEGLADVVLSAPGVEVDQFAVLDGATLNLKGKRVRVTLPVMTFEPGDEKWLFGPPKPIGGETT